jgi:hypothetical protein
MIKTSFVLMTIAFGALLPAVLGACTTACTSLADLNTCINSGASFCGLTYNAYMLHLPMPSCSRVAQEWLTVSPLTGVVRS